METSDQDKKIIQGCIDGRRDAWERFVRRFSGLITWSIKQRLLKSGCSFTHPDVEDIHQEVFLSLYNENKLSQLKDPSKIAGWLCLIAGNAATDYTRRRGARLAKESISLFEDISKGEWEGAATIETLKAAGPLPSEQADQKLKEETLSRAIESLSPKEKIILNLYYLYENTMKEIASHLGMQEGTIASIISRAKEKIKQIL